MLQYSIKKSTPYYCRDNSFSIKSVMPVQSYKNTPENSSQILTLADIGATPDNFVTYGADTSIYLNRHLPICIKVYDKAAESLNFSPPFMDLENYQYQTGKLAKAILGKKIRLPNGRNIPLLVNPIFKIGKVMIDGKNIPYSQSFGIRRPNLRTYITPPGRQVPVEQLSTLDRILTPECNDAIVAQLKAISAWANKNVLRNTTKLSTLNILPVTIGGAPVFLITDIRNFVYPNRQITRLFGAAQANRNVQL